MHYKSLFLISVGINVIIGVLLFQRIGTRPANISRNVPSPAESSTAPAPASEPLTAKAEPKRFGWDSVESPDYKQCIQNLRAVGCPENTIRDIIEADVLKLYDAKKKQVRKAAPKFEYWKGDNFLRGSGRDAWMKMLALDDEQEKVMRELGVEPNYRKKRLKEQNGRDWLLDFLSDEKKAEILRIRTALENTLSRRSPDMDPNEMGRLADENEAAIKRLLTSDEALQYDLRLSPLATRLRNEIKAMDPTEEEFIALYKLRAAHERERQSSDAKSTPNFDTEKMQEQIKQTLGPERYAEYQLAQDFAYQVTHRFALEVGLGLQDTKQLYQTRKDAEQAASLIQNDSTLAAEKRAEALQAIRQETEKAMRAMLGDRTWEQYQRTGHSSWLGQMVRVPAPAQVSP
jgi:hypothetical protein